MREIIGRLIVIVGRGSREDCPAGHSLSGLDKHVQLHHHQDPRLQHRHGPGGLAPRLHAPRLPLPG